jgi:hypothetical protein
LPEFAALAARAQQQARVGPSVTRAEMTVASFGFASGFSTSFFEAFALRRFIKNSIAEAIKKKSTPPTDV